MTTLAAGLFVGAPGSIAAPTPPPPPSVSNPTNDQLSRANAAKATLDSRIGALSGELAAGQARLDELQRQAQLAEQRVALTVNQYRDAVAAAERAKAAVVKAKKVLADATTDVQDEQTQFARYMQATYMDGRPAGLAGTLLTADDPTALLDQTNYQQYEVEHQAGVIGRMQTLTVAKSNAAAATQRARDRAQQAKVRADERRRAAEQAQQRAASAVGAQQSEQAGIQGQMNQTQGELNTAKAQVVQLYNNRATYVQYRQELNAYNAYVAEQRRIAAARRAAALERARQQAAAERAKRDRDNGGGNSGGGGNNGGGNGGGNSDDDPPRSAPPPPSSGGWSQAKGNRAVARAKRYLGDTYAWAGGNAQGPTYGVCVDGAAANDCYIKGFDCSGLVMYAWGKNWDHYADTQYSQAGSYHPSISRLKPGDLMFFGYRGRGSDLHHVAMYVGRGKMIEAPQSNDVIQISSIYKYSDYYGATRPLT